MLDSLKYVKKLEGAGASTQLAEAQVEIMAEVINTNLATRENLKDTRIALKQDIKDLRVELKSEIQEVRTELKSEIQEVRTELKSEIQEVWTELKSEIQEVRTELKSEIQAVRTEIGDVRTSLTHRIDRLEDKMNTMKLQLIIAMGSTMLAGTTLTIAILEYLKK